MYQLQLVKPHSDLFQTQMQKPIFNQFLVTID